MEEKNAIFSYASLESKRFGYEIYRGQSEEILISEIETTFEKEKADILILRFPTHKIKQLQKVSAQEISYILADTFLVFGTSNIQKQDAKPCTNKTAEFCLTSTYSQEIESCIRAVFNSYNNHYNTNPLFKKTAISEGYVEWGLSFLNETNKEFWVAKSNGKVVGFFTIQIEKNIVSTILGGVLKAFRGKGLFRDMIRFSQNLAKKKGYSCYQNHTQISNKATQNVLTSENMKLLESYYTIHLFRKGLL